MWIGQRSPAYQLHCILRTFSSNKRFDKAWRDSGYHGASRTTRALLKWWFQREHIIPQSNGTATRFRWYFAQREAVESAIWLYEVAKARDPYSIVLWAIAGWNLALQNS